MGDVKSDFGNIEGYSALIDCLVEVFASFHAIVGNLLLPDKLAVSANRKTLLVAGSQRALQTGEAIVSLAAKQFVEDMAVLSRTLAEAVINTCYLQVCDDQEMQRFMIFDPIADLKLLHELTRASGSSPSPYAEAILGEMAAGAKASGLFGKSPRSWTEVSLQERACLSDAAIDNRFNPHCLQFLRTFVYQHGHTFVHFTRRGLGHFAGTYLKSGEFSSNQRAMQTAFMLLTANYGAMALASFIMSKFNLDTHRDWNAVQSVLGGVQHAIDPTDIPDRP